MSKRRVYTAGDCPVCADSGSLLCVRSIATGEFALFCPLCETAWKERPVDGRVDTILSLEEVAPRGISPAEHAGLSECPLGPLIEVDFDEWYPLLAPHFKANEASNSDADGTNQE